jgi:hypothetical protein
MIVRWCGRQGWELGKDLAKPGEGIEAVSFGSRGHGEEDGGGAAAAVVAAEEPVFAADGAGSNGPSRSSAAG